MAPPLSTDIAYYFDLCRYVITVYHSSFFWTVTKYKSIDLLRKNGFFLNGFDVRFFAVGKYVIYGCFVGLCIGGHIYI